MEHPTSRIVFEADSTETQNRLRRRLEKFLKYSRRDSMEIRIVSRPLDYGEEETIYVIVYTGNIAEMMAELTSAGLLEREHVLDVLAR